MSHKIIPYPCDYKNTSSVRRARRAGNVFVLVLCGIILLLIGTGVFFVFWNGQNAWKVLCGLGERISITEDGIGFKRLPADSAEAPEDVKPAEPDVQRAAADDTAFGFNVIPDVVDSVTPGVIGVLNYQKAKGKTDEPVLAGSGSGFIYSEDGYIITNHHVIEGAAKLKVSMKDGTIYDAKLVGGDVMTDVAVLKIEATGLKALPIGDSSKARVGDFVLAIGDPISADELSGSVTFGIVSALSREINIEGFVNEYLQTDAAVNPGNSGGPLINMKGEVIGVTSAKYTTAGYDEVGRSISSEGIGFALPINNVVEIAESLIKNGSTVRPGIGISVATYNENSDRTPGVYIEEVSEDGPADKAGAKVGDRLISMDGVILESQDAFIEAVRAKKLGDELKLVVDRNGETVELTIVVGDLNVIHK